MAKELNFSYNGKDYRLAYDRKTIKQMEQQGFITSELGDKPMSSLPTLFAGAFKKYHPFVKQKDIDEIFDHMKNKRELIEKLSDMFSEPFEALFDEPEDDEKNVEWTASF